MKVKISQVAKVPTIFGEFQVKVYQELDNGKEHIAIFTSDLDPLDTPMVRIHSECYTGDTLGSLKCDCMEQFHLALDMIRQNSGLVMYLRQEGRGIGLLNKINAYALQDKGLNTIEANHQLGFEADERNYDIAGFILGDLGISKVKLITNNPQKASTLIEQGIEVVDKISVIAPTNPFNQDYIKIKKELMGHLF